MEHKKVNVMGMDMEEWTHKSCVVEVAEGDDWATIYGVISKERGKGHATELLTEMKKYYTSQGKRFGGTVALNKAMKHIYEKLGITEYV